MKIKLTLLIILPLFIYSCSTSKKTSQKYYYVEPFKEQEVLIVFKDDSTFVLSDIAGCNQFEFDGVYRRKLNAAFNYLVFDSVKFKQILLPYDSTSVFNIKTGDTAWIIGKKRMIIQKHPFRFTTKSSPNLQRIRYKKLKDYYMDLLGRDEFIKTFGNGKGIREAKKRLLNCTIPDINFK